MCSYTDSYGKDSRAGRIMVILVTTGVDWSRLKDMSRLLNPGAGANSPPTGFGNVLWKGMKVPIG